MRRISIFFIILIVPLSYFVVLCKTIIENTIFAVIIKNLIHHLKGIAHPYPIKASVFQIIKYLIC